MTHMFITYDCNLDPKKILIAASYNRLLCRLSLLSHSLDTAFIKNHV